MIEPVKDLPIDQVRKKLDVYHVTRLGIGHTNYFHHQVIIVAMKVGIIALPKYFIIPVLIPAFVIQSMSRIEMFLSEYCYLVAHTSKYKNKKCAYRKSIHIHDWLQSGCQRREKAQETSRKAQGARHKKDSIKLPQ
jgi:hypothetical protein